MSDNNCPECGYTYKVNPFNADHSCMAVVKTDLATVTANLKEMTGYRDKWKADCITTENKLIALKKSIKQALEE